MFNSGEFVRLELPDLCLPLLFARSTSDHQLQPPCRRWRRLPGAWHCHCNIDTNSNNQIIDGIFRIVAQCRAYVMPSGESVLWIMSNFSGLIQHQKFSGEYHTWGKQFQCYFLRTRQEMEADSVHFALSLSILWWKWNWSFLYLVQDNKCTTIHRILDRTIFRKLHVRSTDITEQWTDWYIWCSYFR